MGSTILFRCDASGDIGLGHLIRCLAIADELEGHTIAFASLRDPSNARVTAAGHRLVLIRKGEGEGHFLDRAIAALRPDAVVLDTRYPYNVQLISSARAGGRRVILVDNLCPGMAACDDAVIPNAHFDKAALPAGVPPDRVWTGPEFVILREEVRSLRPKKDTVADRPVIAVTTGGSDPAGILLKILPWLAGMGPVAQFTAFVGDGFKHRDALGRVKRDLPENVTVRPYAIGEIANADIVICTFGMSAYEMVYLGKPTICISHSVENSESARALADRYGVIVDAGYAGDLRAGDLRTAIARLLPPAARTAQARRCEGFIDGRGAQRTASIVEGKHENIGNRSG